MNNDNSSKRSLVSVENAQSYIICNNKQYLNLSSNDYLGLSSIKYQQEFLKTYSPFNKFVLSNPSSRLMTGNSICYEELERTLASYFKKENSLVLSSGFLVNSSLIGALTEKDDLIIADKLVHASMIDGIKLSGCDFERFRHNDTNHFRQILERKRSSYRNVYVMVESIYSMDGDIAPLKELVEFKNEFDLKLYVDEAHAFGVRGENGRGIAEELGIEQDIEIIVATLGKAAASQGGFVICNNEIKDRLVNKMRSLIFSTALPDISLMWSKYIIEMLPSLTKEREYIKYISLKTAELLGLESTNSHIIPYIVGSNKAAINFQNQLKNSGFWVNAIRYPTVAKGSERLRISLGASISEADMINFSKYFVKFAADIKQI